MPQSSKTTAMPGSTLCPQAVDCKLHCAADKAMTTVMALPEVQALFCSPVQGAATPVLAAVGREWEGKGGVFLEASSSFSNLACMRCCHCLRGSLHQLKAGMRAFSQLIQDLTPVASFHTVSKPPERTTPFTRLHLALQLSSHVPA